MKKNRLLYFGLVLGAVLVMAFSLAGCGSDEEQAPTEETTAAPTTTTQATTEESENALYKSELTSLIDEYGRGDGTGAGVNYAKLMDLDGDDRDEMIVIHDMNLVIFGVKEDQVVTLFEGKAGTQYGQTDTGYEVLINESYSPTTIVLFDSQDEWVDENITAVTVSGGAVSTKSLKASTSGENDTPAREELQTFSIDGASVSAGDYDSEYSRLTEGADSINPMEPSDLDSLMSSM